MVQQPLEEGVFSALGQVLWWQLLLPPFWLLTQRVERECYLEGQVLWPWDQQAKLTKVGVAMAVEVDRVCCCRWRHPIVAFVSSLAL